MTGSEQISAALMPYAVMIIGGLLSVVGVLALLLLRGIRDDFKEFKEWARAEFGWVKAEFQIVHGRVTDVASRVSTIEGRIRDRRSGDG